MIFFAAASSLRHHNAAYRAHMERGLATHITALENHFARAIRPHRHERGRIWSPQTRRKQGRSNQCHRRVSFISRPHHHERGRIWSPETRRKQHRSSQYHWRVSIISQSKKRRIRQMQSGNESSAVATSAVTRQHRPRRRLPRRAHRRFRRLPRARHRRRRRRGRRHLRRRRQGHRPRRRHREVHLSRGRSPPSSSRIHQLAAEPLKRYNGP